MILWSLSLWTVVSAKPGTNYNIIITSDPLKCSGLDQYYDVQKILRRLCFFDYWSAKLLLASSISMTIRGIIFVKGNVKPSTEPGSRVLHCPAEMCKLIICPILVLVPVSTKIKFTRYRSPINARFYSLRRYQTSVQHQIDDIQYQYRALCTSCYPISVNENRTRHWNQDKAIERSYS